MVGRAGSPAEIAARSPEQLVEVETQVLCAVFGLLNSPWAQAPPPPALRIELEGRRLFDADTWRDIERYRLLVGMSDLAVLASRGSPRSIAEGRDDQGRRVQHWTLGPVHIDEPERRVELPQPSLTRILR